jgi:hypothetical protein
VDGRYFSQFDRQDPLQGPARDQAWSGTAHALIAELGVGTVTATTLQMGYGLAGLFAGIGLTVLVAGLGSCGPLGGRGEGTEDAGDPAAHPA